MSSPSGYRIFVTGPTLAAEALKLLDARGCRCAFVEDSASPEGMATTIREMRVQGLVVRLGQVTRQVLAASPDLRAVSKHGVGVDNIDLAAATELGIPVMITPAANFEAVAEHAMALMYGLTRRVPRQDALTRRGQWPRHGYDGEELLGRTLGIVGFGRIGRRLAELVGPLRMDVVVYDPYWQPEARLPGIRQVPTLDELLACADIVSLHSPLTPETRGLIGPAQFARMKRGAYLVNTARGGLVDEQALVESLQAGHLAGAAVDAFSQEPPPADHPLFALDNVVLSSHIAGFSDNAFRNMGVGAVKNILAVLDGERPDPGCVLNPEVFG